MSKSIYRSIVLTIVMFVLLGCIYPLVVTICGKYFFPNQSLGGLVYKNEKPVGSLLIAQNFSQPKYFWGRPSAAGDKGFDATNSSASNLAATNKALIDRMEQTIQKFLKENPTVKRDDIPVDLVTMSASGLDPDIFLQAARIQIPRIAKVRNISENKLQMLVEKYIQKPAFGFIGSENVNVLLLNIALDKETENLKK
ncbi:potassium-transporting ATPase subunit KdpC [Silvanigrella aquatica]|uniref:Potassium-transporting ATPase KdpC subunit n=1 Tax=Silvanigrella aquatica TaxID=1915309 RepID=A0A1L4D0L2_9BACT|nr:potassium-transporting ATPase subunit KdpC [Silvanigrella aquatica]APJ03741.1 potassium-transporting ATPase subunit C [Silvanigrella aquatica]